MRLAVENEGNAGWLERVFHLIALRCFSASGAFCLLSLLHCTVALLPLHAVSKQSAKVVTNIVYH